MKQILVIGGAGYIGSHMVWLLGQKGVNVVVLDNLSNGYRDAITYGRFVFGDVSDSFLLDKLFCEVKFDAVIHFASFIQVGESVCDPEKYYRNNVVNTLGLMDSMCRNGVNNLIFSSTAAIFGEPLYSPIDEKHPKDPINPYGRSKYIIEQALADYDRAYGFKSVSLRYFNAAGAHPDGLLGERHSPETHLIPLVLQAVLGKRKEITVFGRDYETKDGTCVRDYIHVLDLAEAHWLAIRYLCEGGKTTAFNLGNGAGFSVDQVVRAVSLVTGMEVPVVDGIRRDGDPAHLVADSSLIQSELGWTPIFPDLDTIVRHAWIWEKIRPVVC